MQLTDEEILEFSRIWRAEFGETLDGEQARIQAGLLIELYEQLADYPCEPAPSSIQTP
jgi:hypothetical protein